MTPYAFGQKIARVVSEKRAWGGASSMTSSPPNPTGKTLAPPKPPEAPKPPKAPQAPKSSLLNDMSNNSARVAGGILSTVAGGVGALGTGVVSGATGLWNMATPKSMNTSEAWSQGADDMFKKTVDFAAAGARDVYGGLGGDTDYNRQRAWEKMEEGFNAPGVDPTSKAIAQGAGWGGHIAFNAATAIGNPGKILTNAPRAGLNPRTWASAGSRIIPGATGGVTSTATAGRATANMARAGTAINHADTVGNLSEMANAGQRFYQDATSPEPVPEQPSQPDLSNLAQEYPYSADALYATPESRARLYSSVFN